MSGLLHPAARRLGSLLTLLGGLTASLHAQSVASRAAPAVPAAPALVQQLEAYVQQFVQAGSFNGTVLVADQGQVVLQRGYGLADRARLQPNTPDTRFHIGSLTKQFTAALVLRLVEQGQLRLAGTVADYLPDYPAVGRQLTLHQLLSHTSGLPDYTHLPTAAMALSHPQTPTQLVALFASLPLEFTPGTQFHYSNSNYVLLGAILEHVSGQPYARLVNRYLAQPAHLVATAYALTWPTGASHAQGYAVDWQSAPPISPTVAYAAGGLTASATDLYRWSQALDADRVLSSTSQQVLFTPGRAQYAYGWSVFKTIIGLDSVLIQEHNGAINGFSSYLIRVPQRQQTIILLDNHSSPALPELRCGLLRLLAHLPALPLSTTAVTHLATSGVVTGPLSEAVLRTYLGVYELAPTFRITIRQRAGQLFAQATGQSEFATVATSPGLFTLQGVAAQLEFQANSQGKVVSLVLHQGGRDTPAPKVE
jgi:CubicO group peptidase (beta-lactamase class C family)